MNSINMKEKAMAIENNKTSKSSYINLVQDSKADIESFLDTFDSGYGGKVPLNLQEAIRSLIMEPSPDDF